MAVMENIERPKRLTMTMIHTATEVQVLIAYCPIEDMVVLVDMVILMLIAMAVELGMEVMDSMVALEALADIVHIDQQDQIETDQLIQGQ